MEQDELYSLFRERCKETARNEDLITYSDLVLGTGLSTESEVGRIQISQILGMIGEDEAAAGRPLITAVVVHKGEGTPGVGFYDLAQRCNKLRLGQDRYEFWVGELKKVYQYWASEEK